MSNGSARLGSGLLNIEAPGANDGQKTWMNRLDLFLIGALGILLAVALAPAGPLGSRIGDWREKREMSVFLRDHWSMIASSASSTSDSGGTPEIVEITDYECPFCRLMHLRLSSLSNDPVTVGHLHFPLPSHSRSRTAALAAICAEHQGHFSGMHDYLMTETTWIDGLAWDEVAVAAGVPSVPGFLECLSSSEASQRLTADMELVRRLGVNSTPTYVTGKDLVTGTRTADELRAMVLGEGRNR